MCYHTSQNILICLYIRLSHHSSAFKMEATGLWNQPAFLESEIKAEEKIECTIRRKHIVPRNYHFHSSMDVYLYMYRVPYVLL